MRGKQTNLKYRDLTDIFAGKHYVSISVLRKKLKMLHPSHNTLLCYLVEWKKQKKIYPAGRGWYTDLDQPFLLSREFVEKYVLYLKKTFPLLEFKCWSTYQLMNFHHHLPLRYSTFIYVDRYSMEDVAESLKENMKDESVFIHPLLKNREILSCKGNRIIIRPLLYDDRQTPDSFYMPMEDILVDYAIEAERLMLIDSAEYRVVFENTLQTGRLNISALLRRIAHRKIENPNITTIYNILT